MAKKRNHKPHRHISNSTPNKSLNYFPTPPNPTIDITTNWLLSGCKYPRTLSSDTSSHSLRADVDAGAADVDGMTYSYGPTEESPRLTDLSPGSVRASARFFVAPAATGSLIEEARLSGAGAAAADALATSRSTPAELVMRRRDKSLNEEVRGELPMKDGHNKVYKSFSDAAAAAVVAPRVEVRCGGVAAVAYSDDPCADFRASMMEMVAAACHVERGEPLDDYWGFMEELLFCYLELNERSVYKYIFMAFADVAKNRSPEHRRRIPVDDVD